MCGITGFWDFSGKINGETMQNVIQQMSDQLIHRGPDDSGIWLDTEFGLAFGHRRLSIVDLTPEGHQPMISVSGRYVIVFNGEIYNFKLLRRELETMGYGFRGHSDTEVMLMSIETWGLENAVKRFTGMFAFALWDRKEHQLYLVRDRVGEKPLYYGWMGDVFLFGSELKALNSHSSFVRTIDRDALALYMRHNYIPAPYSIYKNIFKLPPGTILSVDIKNGSKISNMHQYWSAHEVAETGIREPFIASEAEMIGQLDELLRESIKQQMVADVPLGAFLSGGIDSSLVVALMQTQSQQSVKTFTIGFNEPGYNEAEHGKAIAKYLGTSHTELYVTPQQAMSVIPKLPTLYDEPFSDSSQIPTFLVAELARKHVTVSLSGDGGDELFGGYNRYFWGRSLWNKIGWTPKSFRKMTAACLTVLSPRQWNQGFESVNSILPIKFKYRLLGDKLHKLAEILVVETPEMMYQNLVSHWKNPSSLVLSSTEPLTSLNDQNCWIKSSDLVQRMMYLDMITYLPNDILVKVDRAAMGVSLETRIPMLDHRIVEFAWRLPMSMKIRDGQGKWLLRQVLYQYVPKELVERPKMGFGVPIDSWLRGPLREWAEDLLDEKRLREEGYFQPEPILEKWKEHQTGGRNWQYYLWDVLMFQAWLRNNK